MAAPRRALGLGSGGPSSEGVGGTTSGSRTVRPPLAVSRPLPTARASARRARGHGGPSSASAAAPPERAGGAERRWRDAQAGVPSTRRPRAQLAFKDSMVRGILQFTPGIAFRYVLHRWESRDIRCRESSGISFGRPRGAHAGAPRFRLFVFLGAMSRRGSSMPPVALPPRPRGRGEGRRGRADGTGGCPPRRRSFTSSRSSLVRHRQ